MIDKELTGKIIHAAYTVHNILKFGFLESVYQKALKKELVSMGLKCECEKPLDVYYKGEIVGHFVTDILVEDSVIIELKAVKALKDEHEWQLVNYLTATGLEVGLLINFGHNLEVKRKICTKKP
ncbi:MAG: GxxExxY protein [Prevotella sp.]|nr:GxxExxY protein [Prevotella sp.]